MTTATSPATTSSATGPTLSGIGVGRGSAVGSVVKLAAAARPPANEPAATDNLQAETLVSSSFMFVANNLRVRAAHPVIAHLSAAAEPHAYFVHSFHLCAVHAGDVLADTDYGGAVAAVAGRDNMIGTQFHPEKSQAVGLQLLQNFARWRP